MWAVLEGDGRGLGLGFRVCAQQLLSVPNYGMQSNEILAYGRADANFKSWIRTIPKGPSTQ